MGFAQPRVLGTLAAFTELFGGLALAIGLYIPIVAAMLAVDMVVAIKKAHWSKGFFVQKGGYEYPLEIIQHQQEVPAAQEGFERLEQRAFLDIAQAECLGDDGHDQPGITDRGELHQADAVGKGLGQVCRHLERQARFADATGACEREKPDLGPQQESADLPLLLFASNQRRERGREILVARGRTGARCLTRCGLRCRMGNWRPGRWEQLDGRSRSEQVTQPGVIE